MISGEQVTCIFCGRELEDFRYKKMQNSSKDLIRNHFIVLIINWRNSHKDNQNTEVNRKCISNPCKYIFYDTPRSWSDVEPMIDELSRRHRAMLAYISNPIN